VLRMHHSELSRCELESDQSSDGDGDGTFLETTGSQWPMTRACSASSGSTSTDAPSSFLLYRHGARGSAMECAAIVDAFHVLGLASDGAHAEAVELLERIVAMTTKWCRGSASRRRRRPSPSMSTNVNDHDYGPRHRVMQAISAD
jgi:hypothetical protein